MDSGRNLRRTAGEEKEGIMDNVEKLAKTTVEHTVEIALLKQNEKEKREMLQEILSEVKKTNGRVTKLEQLKAYVVGGLAVGGLKLIYEVFKMFHP